jgi:hypothetical protein
MIVLISLVQVIRWLESTIACACYLMVLFDSDDGIMGGRHTGNSLMQDAGVDQELRMREVGHADRSVNDRYTHPLEQAHLAASEQTAALVRNAAQAS